MAIVRFGINGWQSRISQGFNANVVAQIAAALGELWSIKGEGSRVFVGSLMLKGLIPLLFFFFALCGMWRLARFNVNTDVVHGYFMGLAIPAGGCIVASTTLLFTALGIEPQMFGYVYPVTMAVVAYLMVSHVHYPDFKGDGETLFLLPKALAALMFASILFFGRESILPALLVAIFCTYAVFGIINSLFALFAKTE